MTHNEARERAQEIVQIAKKFLTDKDGIFIRGKRGEEVFSQQLINDIGDFLPLIAFFGNEDICETHLRFVEENKSYKKFTNAFDFSDLLFGLVWYARIGGKHKERSLKLAKEVEEFFSKHFYKKHLVSYRGLKGALGIFNSIDATFIEVYTEFYKTFGEERYLEKAKDLAEFLLQSRAFKKYGYLPEFFSTSSKDFAVRLLAPQKYKDAVVMKHNSSFAFALIELYKETKDPTIKQSFDKLIDSIFATTPNAVPGNAIKNGKASESSLLPSFILVDALTDASVAFQEERYKEKAQKLANFWLEKQDARTGLFPMRASGRLSYLDSETDMAIALLKLAEQTGEQKYEEAAKKAIEGIYAHHSLEQGLALEIDVKTGEVANPTIKTKFNLLALKPYIFACAEEKIYQSEKLFTLLKDR